MTRPRPHSSPPTQLPQALATGPRPRFRPVSSLRNAAVSFQIDAWLLETNTPILFLYASRGALNPPKLAEWWAQRAKNIETVFVGAGLHFVQEDQPYAIGRAIADWNRRPN